jgi:hypothetical protein
MHRTLRHTTVAALGLAFVLATASCSDGTAGTPAAAAAAHDSAAHDTTRPDTTAHDTTAHDTTTDSAVAPDGELIDAVAFHADMRKLWEDHVTWTRLYLVSAIAELPDLEATAARLLQNQDDIGAAVAVFYGDEAGDQLAALLREHILIAADLVTAAKAGDSEGVTTHNDRWYVNADEIAAFLAAANPAWPEATLRDMMRAHLDQTLAEATARLQADWEADIAEYDRIHLHILAMADTLADGIVEQFPERFTA